MVIRKTRATRTKKSSLFGKVKNICLSSQGLPLILSFAVICILFVLFRMKGVELEYKITSLSKDVDKVVLESKELKAHKARLLSVKRLRGMAKKYKLAPPKQDQIIVIP